jgi:phosphoglycerol transferase MdoB-like AlkP superfamily enzyme
MHNYFQHVILLFKRFLWLLALYFLSRLFFYILNAGYFSDLSFPELLKIFVTGMRFDIAAIVFTNFFLLFFIVPGTYKNSQVILRFSDILFVSVNFLALLCNFIDARFFDFINKRMTSSIFTLMGANKDVWLMIPQFLKDYWYVAASFILVAAALWIWRPKLNFNRLLEEKLTRLQIGLQFIIFIVILGFMLLGARGTHLKPVGIIDAANYTAIKNVPLLLNTPFSIVKTLENENLESPDFFPEDSLSRIYYPIHQFQTVQHTRKLNVVIIILESFSKEYSGYLSGHEGYTPCLDSMLKLSRVYVNAFANGTQSYEAMPAIIASMPSLMERPYSGSNYADNLIESLPGLLRKEGYHTAFYHGGNNGTMGFKNFARVAGIEYYMGRTEYNNDADFDGHWGIWDEPYLQYFARQIDAFPQPFITAIFTLSSHHPYNVPEKYKFRFTEGELPIHKSIQYADYALGKFFQTARKTEWYKNTLFVLTADHAAQAISNEYNSNTGMYAIPIAFFNPTDSTLTGKQETIAQQIDIMPSVLDYLGYNKPFFAFGESLFNASATHRAIGFINGMYQLIEGDYVLVFSGKRVISFYNRKLNSNGPGKKNPIINPEDQEAVHRMERTMKAIIQTYNSRLINNKTSLK